MKKRTKPLLILFIIFISILAITICTDILFQYKQEYAAAPYVKMDSSSTLNIKELIYKTPKEDISQDFPPYYLGWLRSDSEEYPQDSLMYCAYTSDARNDKETSLIENAGYHLFSLEENKQFYSLLENLQCHPVHGINNLLIHKKINKSNFIASFQLREFYGKNYESWSAYSDDPSDNKIEYGEIFTVGNKTYLAGCFNVGAIYNEKTKLYDANPAVKDSNGNSTANWLQYSLFEIEPSDALDTLLSKKELFRGGEKNCVSRHTPFPISIPIKLSILVECGVFLLILLIILVRKKKLIIRLLSLLALLVIVVAVTFTLGLYSVYQGYFVPSVYNDVDATFTYNDLFSDVANPNLKQPDEKSWPPIINVSYRLAFLFGGIPRCPEEVNNENFAEATYRRDDWRKDYFSQADTEEFDEILHQLSFRSIKGFGNIIPAINITNKKFIAYFERSTTNKLRRYKANLLNLPCVVSKGQFFTANGHTYLLAQFEIDEKFSDGIRSKYFINAYGTYYSCYSLFEVEPSKALDRLLKKQDDFRGIQLHGDSSLPFWWLSDFSNWLYGESIVFALAACFVLVDNKKQKEKMQIKKEAKEETKEISEDENG